MWAVGAVAYLPGMKCPNCGAEDQGGKYCGECGAALSVRCAACGEDVPPGARFCTACGEPVATAASGRGSMAPWVIATAALLVVVLVLFLPRRADRVPAPPPVETEAPLQDGGTATPGEGIGPLSSDMRTNADRLFNRIMLAAEEGDRAEVEQFMPMAIQAYRMVEDLDEDGLYHLGILHLTAGDYAEARQVGERILDRSPDHILALGVAASAADAAGDTEAARAFWERLLDAYPEEAEKPIPEYLDHRSMLLEYRSRALEATGRS